MKTDNMSEGQLKKLLFDNVVKMPDWEKVVKIYEEDCRAHSLKITSSGHTALHLAISSSKKKIVHKLVELIITTSDDNNMNTNNNDKDINYKEALRIKNEKGHTPLHMAAATGSRKMCKFIIEGGGDAGKTLVLEPDNKGETPLFRAVQYGRKKAFLYLQSVVCDYSNISYCWRYDDQTILHNAIIRENFGE